MAKSKQLEAFVKLIRTNFYFTSTEFGKNKWKWYDKDRDLVLIFNEKSTQIRGIQDIGAIAKALDLSCRAEYSITRNRLEIWVS